jgi:hypothetical protein
MQVLIWLDFSCCKARVAKAVCIHSCRVRWQGFLSYLPVGSAIHSLLAPPTPEWPAMLLLRRIAMSILAGYLLLMGSSSARAQQPKPPSLNFIQPLGIQPGNETEVILTGERLAVSGKVWTSATAENSVSAAGQSETVANCKLNLPADTPLGLLGVRYFNPTGVSNLRLMLVDDLKGTNTAGRPRSLVLAMPLVLPTAVEGNCEAETACYFKFTATAAQRVSLEVFARRLASPLDPILRVLDATGKELVYRDDEPGLMGDCRLSFEAPLAGEYFVELRDVRYAGGAEYRFRLRAGSFPLANVVFPPAVKRGGTADVVACVTEGEPAAAVQVNRGCKRRFGAGPCAGQRSRTIARTRTERCA